MYSSTRLLATNLQHMSKETYHHPFCSVLLSSSSDNSASYAPMLIANSLDQIRRSKVDPEQVGKQTI